MEQEINNNRVNAAEPPRMLHNSWSIRPCTIYKAELDECKSIKGRFHQYFIHGKNSDCSQWQRDFDNCMKFDYSNGVDLAAGQELINSEEQRRGIRLRAHYANNTWSKRSDPPADWAKPLPEWFNKRTENSFLEQKQKELDGRAPLTEATKSYCTIM